jgi:hypothetical protein
MKKLFLILLIILSNLIYSQKYELGEVTIEELKEKSHTKDTSAAAAVLFRKGVSKIEYSQSNGFELIMEVQTKIKIYKKEGYDLANQQIRYYDDGSNKEKVFISEANSFNLLDNKVVKTKLKKESEFEERINKYRKIKKIIFPDVKEGTIIEYKYKIISPFFSDVRDWNFEEKIPVNFSEYQTKITEYFTYNIRQKGSFFPSIKNDSSIKSIVFHEKERKEGPGRTVSTSFSQSSVDYKENINTYTLKNIPAIKDEGYVNNIDNYTTGIIYELSTIKYPNSMLKTYSTDWETVVQTIYDNDHFGSELNKNGYFEKDILALVQNLSTRDEKIGAIFNYVKSTINWNGYRGYNCEDGVKTAYKNKVGNVAEINLMLTAMLRFAGIDANPILISTRDNGVAFFPSRTAYNYVIAGVEIENGVILLDATEKYLLPNLLPERAINWNGRIIRKNGSSADISLTPNFISKEVTNMLLNVNPDGKMEGKIRTQKNDYLAYQFRNDFNSLTEDSYLEKIEKKLNDSEISDYKIENKHDLGKPIVETFSFVNTKEIEKIGDKIYINPLVFFALNENPFKQEKREYPVDFTFPEQDKCQVIVNLPENYVVESIPTPINLMFADKDLEFLFNISNSGKQIQVISQLNINTSIVTQDNYEELKAFFNEVVKKQTEKIVLKKV